MKNRTYQYLILIAIALGLLFVVSCGDEAGFMPGAGTEWDNPSRGAAGLLLPTAVQISNSIDDQSTPDTAYDPSTNTFLVVWTDARDIATRKLDIYGSLVTPGTTPRQFHSPI